ncbi:deoxyguanosinetriphosphate triphosphohydrolase family protein [Cedecea sp. MMO-103]|uniref:deoxyguanosinetriphosphate triphosphohydrolase family protein n=1 Tax=Cedecea sp. MMO-103 TaxID=3081238 RepID=UPI003019B34B
MQWSMLLNDQRRKDKHEQKTTKNSAFSNTSGGRQEIERDYDRILFAAPTRRLADKTQVFPLDQNDSVRTRLTHSHEVANLARSIGVRLAFEFREKVFDDLPVSCQLQRDVPALLAAIGLAHDLGNPPFGHQGETAMQEWFTRMIDKETNANAPFYDDFRLFDGNAQTFRLVTKLQILNDTYGLNLTYATLASLIKYPRSSYSADKGIWKKHGYFYSEENIVKEVWEETGLQEGIRHPFTYIMEACDDIAYSILDAEDIVKKGLASFHDLMDFLTCWDEENPEPENNIISDVIDYSKEKNKIFSDKKLKLSPSELNDTSMQMFRVRAIYKLVTAAVDAFTSNKNKFLSTECDIANLISISKGKNLCKALKKFDQTRGYRHPSVLKLELKGSNYIKELMSMLWVGIHGHKTDEEKEKEQTVANNDLPPREEFASSTPFGKYAYGRISENYRRIFEQKDDSNPLPQLYREAQLLADAISGMTDSYLIALHDELKSLYEYEHRQQ